MLGFYRWHQNNSGGSFSEPAINVYIQSPNPFWAEIAADNLGINGNAPYCECCGPRWPYFPEAISADELIESVASDIRYSAGGGRVPTVAVYFTDGRVITGSTPEEL